MDNLVIKWWEDLKKECFANITPMDMKQGDRFVRKLTRKKKGEELWKEACEDVRYTMQFIIAHLRTMRYDKYRL